MAENNDEKSAKPTAPVDIETMKVKLLIVCKDQSRLEPVANFLNRRGWDCQITTKVKDALAAVTTQKPDFVLVSANHPNPKLMKFPTILKTSFQVPTIGFAESSDAKTQQTLQNLPVSYRMAGMLSGPSTQRQIKQILREMYGETSSARERKTNNQNSEGNDDIVLKGSGSKKDSAYVSVKGGAQGPEIRGPGYKPGEKDDDSLRANELAAEFGDDDFDSTDVNSTSEKDSTFVDKGKRAQELKNSQKDLSGDVNDESDADLEAEIANYGKAPEVDANGLPAATHAGEVVKMPTDTSEAPKPTHFEEDFSIDPAELADIVAGVKKDMPSQKEKDAAAKDLAAKEVAAKAAAQMTPQTLAAHSDENQGGNAPAADSSGTSVAPVRRTFTKDANKISFFEKLVIKILNDLTVKRMPTEYRIAEVERLVIISVQSPNTNGYLVVSSSATTKGLREISLELRSSLADFLRQEGKMFEFGSPAMVMCSEHKFFNETEEQLEFSHVAEIADGEVAIKFLAAPQPIPKLSKVESSDKLRVEANEIPLERPVDFKFQIHLEKNKKYVVLIKEGGMLTEKYKERLKEFGKGLFIDEADAEKFKRFFTTAIVLDILKVASFRVEYAEESKPAIAA